MGRVTKNESKDKWKIYIDSTTERVIDPVGTAKNIEDVKVCGISRNLYRPDLQDYIEEHGSPWMATPTDTKYLFLRVNLHTPDNILIEQFKKIIEFQRKYQPIKTRRIRKDLLFSQKIEARVKELALQGLKAKEIYDFLYREELIDKEASFDNALRRIYRIIKKNK